VQKGAGGVERLAPRHLDRRNRNLACEPPRGHQGRAGGHEEQGDDRVLPPEVDDRQRERQRQDRSEYGGPREIAHSPEPLKPGDLSVGNGTRKDHGGQQENVARMIRGSEREAADGPAEGRQQCGSQEPEPRDDPPHHRHAASQADPVASSSSFGYLADAAGRDAQPRETADDAGHRAEETHQPDTGRAQEHRDELVAHERRQHRHKRRAADDGRGGKDLTVGAGGLRTTYGREFDGRSIRVCQGAMPSKLRWLE